MSQEFSQIDLAIMLMDAKTNGASHHTRTTLVYMLGLHLNRHMATDKTMKGDAWLVAGDVLGWHLHRGTSLEAHQITPAHMWLDGYMDSLTDLGQRETARRLGHG